MVYAVLFFKANKCSMVEKIFVCKILLFFFGNLELIAGARALCIS